MSVVCPQQRSLEGGIPQTHEVWEAALHLPCPPPPALLRAAGVGSSEWEACICPALGLGLLLPFCTFCLQGNKVGPPTQPARVPDR